MAIYPTLFVAYLAQLWGARQPLVSFADAVAEVEAVAKAHATKHTILFKQSDGTFNLAADSIANPGSIDDGGPHPDTLYFTVTEIPVGVVTGDGFGG